MRNLSGVLDLYRWNVRLQGIATQWSVAGNKEGLMANRSLEKRRAVEVSLRRREERMSKVAERGAEYLQLRRSPRIATNVLDCMIKAWGNKK
jgi:hypothetical protein